jgi:hypothetical protein
MNSGKGETMKKMIFGAALLLSAAALFAQLPGQKFTLSARGGWGLYCGGDYNTAAEGYNDYINAFYPLGPGRYDKFRTGFNASLEGVYWFKPNMGVGLGLGWYQSSISDNPVDFDDEYFDTFYNINASVGVMPVTLNFHYQLPICRDSFLDFYFGAGLYFGCFDFHKDYEYEFYDDIGTYDFSGHTTALGLQGGVTFNYPIVKDKIWLFGGVEGRTTSLSDFSDEWTEAGSDYMGPYGGSGTGHQFWVFDQLVGNEKFPLFYFGENMPTASDIQNSRKGSVGGGGISFYIGAKVGF